MIPLPLFDPKNTPPATEAMTKRSAALPAAVSTTQDRLWQQAMHQAQQSGFADWFEGPDPSTKTLLASNRLPPVPHTSTQVGAFKWTHEEVDASDGSMPGSSSATIAAPGQGGSVAGTAGASPTSVENNAPAVRANGSLAGQHVQDGASDTRLDWVADIGAALIRDFTRVGVAISVSQASGEELARAVFGVPSAERWAALDLAEASPPEVAHGDVVPDTDDAERPSAAQRSAVPPTTAANQADPVRVHAEWSAAGVRVWLGAEAGALGAAHELASQLQGWLANHGERLLGLICNGRTLAPSRSASPLPSATEVDADTPLHSIYPPTQEVP
jgi:hypothetical protein